MAGIIRLGDPRPGDMYRQEYYEGEAEDVGAVVSLNESVSVAYGTFDDIPVTADYNPLGPQLEHKYYAAGVGVVKETVEGSSEYAELVRITQDADEADAARGCDSPADAG